MPLLETPAQPSLPRVQLLHSRPRPPLRRRVRPVTPSEASPTRLTHAHIPPASGNCVGRRNHRFFAGMTGCAAAAAAVAVAAAAVTLRVILTGTFMIFFVYFIILLSILGGRVWGHWRWYTSWLVALYAGLLALQLLGFGCCPALDMIRRQAGPQPAVPWRERAFRFWCAARGPAVQRRDHPQGQGRGHC
jgi:hypothetical protein